MTSQEQYLRKISLVVIAGTKALDLSEFHIKFKTQATDVETPNNAVIRIYNLAPNTIASIEEFTEVTLNAGYEGNFGVIFSGTIKQFRKGRENAKDTYLDILAADWDVGYNQGFVSESLKGATPAQIAQAAVKGMVQAVQNVTQQSVGDPSQHFTALGLSDAQHVPLLRTKVMFGMSRIALHNVASKLDASWSIQNGVVTLTAMQGYANGDIVILNRETGMIGIPNQTDGGVEVTCLLNPRLRVTNLVQLDSASINQTEQADPTSAPIAYNTYAGFQNNTKLSVGADGKYRMFVIEHEGDNRGQEWYSHLVCLAVDSSAKKVESPR